jgi:hypothetical protein
VVSLVVDVTAQGVDVGDVELGIDAVPNVPTLSRPPVHEKFAVP